MTHANHQTKIRAEVEGAEVENAEVEGAPADHSGIERASEPDEFTDAWSGGERARMDAFEGDAFADAVFEARENRVALGRAERNERSIAEKTECCGLDELKARLGASLCADDRMRRPDGLPTGVAALDGRLFWGGFPKGEMTLLLGDLGTGATSLWIEAAARVLNAGRWAAWIDGEAPLCPTPLKQKGADLSRLLAAKAAPRSAKAWLKLARELLASTLFDTIGSGDEAALLLRETQARKLLSACRSAKAALVLIARGPPPPYAELFALIVRFEKKRILVERAAYRPPFELPRRVTYATFSQHARANLFVNGENDGPIGGAVDGKTGGEARLFAGDGRDAGAGARALPAAGRRRHK